MTVTGCTLSGNSASTFGGALNNNNGGTAAAHLDCTLEQQLLRSVSGGLFNNNSSSVTLTDCTVSGNSAGDGRRPVQLHWLHGDADRHDRRRQYHPRRSPSDIGGDCASPVTGTYNLIGTGGSGGIAGGSDHNIVLTSLSALGLAPLGNYGGPDPDHGPPARQRRHRHGHPADSRHDHPITTDQRGLIRGSMVDIGAVQVSLVVESTAGTVDTAPPALTLPGAVSLADSMPTPRSASTRPSSHGGRPSRWEPRSN